MHFQLQCIYGKTIELDHCFQNFLAYIILGKSGTMEKCERLVKVDNVEFDQVTPNQQSGKKLTVRSDNPLQ